MEIGTAHGPLVGQSRLKWLKSESWNGKIDTRGQSRLSWLKIRLAERPTNPEILNPEILNPEILNPEILNPEILNPEILNPKGPLVGQSRLKWLKSDSWDGKIDIGGPQRWKLALPKGHLWAKVD